MRSKNRSHLMPNSGRDFQARTRTFIEDKMKNEMTVLIVDNPVFNLKQRVETLERIKAFCDKHLKDARDQLGESEVSGGTR